MKSILITGAASGIGAASARLFHAQGWAVGLLDINQKALAALSVELDGAWYAVVDVCDAESVKAAVQRFCTLHNEQLDVLFNSAGVLRFGRFAELDLSEHQRVFSINVLGLLQVTHAAFVYLKQAKAAQVVNMGSASGLYGTPDMACYSASKFAVRGLTEALQLEWREHGIMVGDLMPPFVVTPMLAAQGCIPPILKRLGVNLKAEDIAQALWRQVHQPKVHRPIHWLFKLMYASAQVTPSFITRAVIGWLNRA